MKIPSPAHSPARNLAEAVVNPAKLHTVYNTPYWLNVGRGTFFILLIF